MTEAVDLAANIFDVICIVGMVILIFSECFRHSIWKRLTDILSTISCVKADLDNIKYELELIKKDLNELKDFQNQNTLRYNGETVYEPGECGITFTPEAPPYDVDCKDCEFYQEDEDTEDSTFYII